MTECDIRDTVSSWKSTLPGTVDGMTHVCYFRHALALDERRVRFLPLYAYGGSAKPLKQTHNTRGTWAVIQLVICPDPKDIQSLTGSFPKRRRFGLQGRTQICQYTLIHK
jgi:hypothetical protein